MHEALLQLSEIRKLVRPLVELKPVDTVLLDLQDALARIRVEYRIVGGLAVMHHGYFRSTKDIDLLVRPSDLSAIEEALMALSFHHENKNRWRHSTGVALDLLIAGETIPRAPKRSYPDPSELESSADASMVVGLSGLVRLKLYAARHQDFADIVALLKNLDQAGYLKLESEIEVDLRPQLLSLYEDALEELAWSR